MQLELEPGHGRYALRLADDKDVEFLWKLKLSTLKDYITELFGWDEAQARSRLESHWRGSYIVLVGGRAVGQLKLTDDEGWVYLAEILILPTHQKQGLGTRIIQDVLAAADHAGRNVDLKVMANNPARRLYERLGFKVTHYKMYRPSGNRQE